MDRTAKTIQMGQMVESALPQAMPDHQIKTIRLSEKELREEAGRVVGAAAQAGIRYEVDKENAALFRAWLRWMQFDESFTDEIEILSTPSLYKGFLILGQVGTGKTLTCKAFSAYSKYSVVRHFFPVVSCREVGRKFQVGGFSEIEQYGPKSYGRKSREGGTGYDMERPLPKCFDDLGAESDVFHYGNRVNIMGEVIQDRYEEFGKSGMITHMTTNLNGAEIEEQYGNRIYSRCKEMFNIVRLTGKDRRR